MALIRGNLLNVSTDEIYGAEIYFNNGIITCVKPVKRNFTRIILPGFIDAHIHVESSMLTPSRFAEAVVPHGTTAIISDPHEIANVMGVKGIDYMIQDSLSVPLKMFITAPSCVPATSYETSGAAISASQIEHLLNDDNIVALGEVMNFPGVLNGEKSILSKIKAAINAGKPVDGHAPMLTGPDLCNYIASGISTDHECTTRSEAIEKRRLGMKIMLREGSSSKNLKTLADAGGDFIVSDDKHPQDLINGHVDEMLRKAVEYGIDPIEAVKMVTINPAEQYNLNTGSFIPGRELDLVVIENLENFNVEKVMINGNIVAENGKVLFKVKPVKIQNTIIMNLKKGSDFDVPSDRTKEEVKVIEIVEGQLITNESSACLYTHDGNLDVNLDQDILKIAVVERYGHNNISNAFVKGFCLKEGAIASSVSHDSHNIVTVGTNSKDMAAAVNTVFKNKGGLAAVTKNSVHVLKLPVAGLMSTKNVSEVASDLDALHRVVSNMGSKLQSPFMTMSFMTLLVIPKLKISDKGLFNVEMFDFVELIKR